MKKSYLILMLLILPALIYAQTSQRQHRIAAAMSKSKTIGTPTVTAAFSVQPADSLTNPLMQIIQSLVGPGVTVSNIQTNLPQTSNIYGSFTGGTNVIGIENGLLLTSGSIYNAVGPNS